MPPNTTQTKTKIRHGHVLCHPRRGYRLEPCAPPPLSAGSDGRDLVLTAALPSLRCDRSRHHTTSLGLLSHLASRDISPASVTSWGGCKEQKMQIHFKVFISWIMSNQLSLNPSLHHSPLGLKVGVREPKKRRLPRKEVQSNF